MIEKAKNISGLSENGKYIIHQATTKDGYVKAEDIAFEVNTNKEDVSYTMINKTFTIHKVDEKGNPLKDVELEVVRTSDNKVVDKWVTDGKGHQVIGLEENNEYILKEVKTVKGYKVSEPMTFKVDNVKENQTLTMKSDLIPVPPTPPVDNAGEDTSGKKPPRTDDNTNIAMYGLLLLGAGVGAYVSTRRKKNEEEAE